MKLRLRLDKYSRVIDIDNDETQSLTVANLSEKVLSVFADLISSSGEFYLSLNKKDVLEDGLKIVGDCDIVSGDLIYVVRTRESHQNAGACGVEQNQSSMSIDGCSNANQPGVQTVEIAHSVCSIDNEQQGTSYENDNETMKPSTIMSVEMSTDTTEPDTSVESGSQAKQARISGGVTSDKEKPGTSAESEQMGAGCDETMETEEPVDLMLVSRCLSEPVLCREATNGTVPALLREIHDAAAPKDLTESLCVVLHVLMLETGFTVHPECRVANLPDEWRYGAYYKLTYTYPGCTDTTCCITIIPTGNTAVIHGKVIGTSEVTRQCTLRSGEFVLSVDKDCAKCYWQLAKLSMVFKDSIANPLVHDIRTAAGLVDVFGLLALTMEIKLRILSFLDVKSLLQISLVNTELSELSKDPYLWRCLYLRNFGNRRDNNSLSQNWKEYYRQEYKVRKERRKAMSRLKLITPPYWGPQNPFSGPSNWIPPGPGGIIGGDYDLYPNFPSSLPGVPGRMGPLPPTLPRPRYDLIGPTPDVDPGPGHGLLPHRPGAARRGGARGGPFGGGFGGMGPRFF